MVAPGPLTVRLRDGNVGAGEHGWGSEWDNQSSRRSYRLTARFVAVEDRNEPNDDIATATPLALGTPLQGSVYPAGDKDCFVLDLPAEERGILTVTVESLPRTIHPVLQMLRADGTEVATLRRADGEDLVFVRHMAAGGRYGFRLRDGNIGRGEHDWGSEWDNVGDGAPYTVEATWQVVPDGAEPNDEPKAAKPVEVGSTVTGYLFPAGDKDAHLVNLPDGTRGLLTLVVGAEAYVQPVVELFGPDGRSIQTYHGRAGHELVCRCELAGGGAHRFLVRDGPRGRAEHDWGGEWDNQAGRYDVTVRWDGVAAPEEQNDTLETARTVAEGTVVAGTLFPRGDRDWYRFELPEGRHEIQAVVEGVARPLCPRLTVHRDGKAVAVARGDKANPTRLVETVLEGPALCAVLVEDDNNGWGEHDWGGEVANVSSPRPYAFVWRRQTAGVTAARRSMTFPGETTDMLYPVGDVDRFTFTVPAERKVQVTVDGYSRALAPHVRVMRGDGTAEVAGAQSGRSSTVVVNCTLAAGDYVVEVGDGASGHGEQYWDFHRHNAQSTTPYCVRVAEAGTAGDGPPAVSAESGPDETARSLPLGTWSAFALAGTTATVRFDLGDCAAGELDVRVEVRSTMQRPVVEVFATTGTERRVLGSFTKTQGADGAVDEAFTVVLPRAGRFGLVVRNGDGRWCRDELRIRATLRPVAMDGESPARLDEARIEAIGAVVEERIWPDGDVDSFVYEVTDKGVLSVRADGADGMPLRLRVGRCPERMLRVLHLVGGRTDYDMFAHRPPGMDITRLTETSAEYLANFRAVGDEPVVCAVDFEGDHPYLVLRGHGVKDGLEVSVGGTVLPRQVLAEWNGWSELAFDCSGVPVGRTEVQVRRRQGRPVVAALRFRSVGVDRVVAPFTDGYLPETAFRGYDTVVVEGLTGPYEFGLDRPALRRRIEDFCRAGGTFLLVCPQFFSYSVVQANGGGKVVRSSPEVRSAEGVIDGRYQVWTSATCESKRVPCDIVLAMPGTMPVTVDRAVLQLHCSWDHEWGTPIEGQDRQVRGIRLAVALDGPDGPWRDVGSFECSRADQHATFRFAPAAARWVKLTIESTHGADTAALPEFELYGPTTVEAFFGVHLQSNWLDDRVVAVAADAPTVRRMGTNPVSGWPSADCNGWFLGAADADFAVLWGDRRLPAERAVTLEKKLGKGRLLIDTQELGHAANRGRSRPKVHALLDWPNPLAVDEAGSDVVDVLEPGRWFVEVQADGGLPWRSTEPYRLAVRFQPAVSAVEPNDTDVLPRDMQVGVPVDDNLFPTGDVDWFRFDVLEPAALRLRLLNVGLGINPRLNLYRQTDMTKPVVQVESSLQGTCGWPESQVVAVTEPGMYLVRVDDGLGGRSSTPYRFAVMPTAADRRFEQNDEPASAVALQAGTAVRAALYPKGDVDWFYVEKGEGPLDVRVDDVPGDADPALMVQRRLDVGDRGVVRLLYLVGGYVEHYRLDKRLAAPFQARRVQADDPAAGAVWDGLADYHAVVIDGLHGLEQFGLDRPDTQRRLLAWIEAGGRLLVAAPVPTASLLSARRGGTVIRRSGQWDDGKWKAENLLDDVAMAGNDGYAWCSAQKALTFPQELVFAFAGERPQRVAAVVLATTAQATGRRVKDFELWASASSPDEGFEKFAAFEAAAMDDPQTFRFEPREVRYLKLVILSNRGDDREVQLGEFGALSPEGGPTLFGVRPVVAWSNAVVEAVTPPHPQATMHGSGPLNGFGWSDLAGWLEGWREAGFDPLWRRRGDGVERAVAVFKRHGRGSMAVTMQQLGPEPNDGARWVVNSLLDVPAAVTYTSNGWVGERGSEERVLVDCPPGRYDIRLSTGAGDLASLSPVKLTATFAAGRDGCPPQAVGVLPPAGSDGISPKTACSVTFSEPLGGTVDTSKVTVRGVSSGVVPVDARVVADEYRLVVTPRRHLANQDPVTVTVGAGAVTDRSGTPLAEPKIWSFQTGTLARATTALAVLLDDEPPLGAGTHRLTLRATKALATVPSVEFRMEGRPARSVTVVRRDELTWTGTFEIPAGVGDGVGGLAPGADMQASLTGQLTFDVDTTPPAQPAGPAVSLAAGGRAVLTFPADGDGLLVLRGRSSSDLAPVGRAPAGATRYEDQPPADGTWSYALSRVDRAGNRSAPSRTASLTVDCTPPAAAPAGFSAQVTAEGKVQLAWQPVADGTVGYDVRRTKRGAAPEGPALHRVDTGAVRVLDGPPDGDWTYHVAARDGAGNVGPAATADVHLDTQAARATVQLVAVEPLAPVTATAPVADRVAPGTWRFTVAVDEALVQGPFVSVRYADGTTAAVELTKQDERTYAGVATVGAQAPDGRVTFVGSAVDEVGNRGLRVQAPSLYLDSRAPEARVVTRRDVRPWAVEVSSSEPLRAVPSLTLRIGTTTRQVPLTLDNGRYLGSVDRVDELPEGEGRWSFVGTDLLGRQGTVIAAGAVFHSDTTPPGQPGAVTVLPGRGGSLRLAWSAPLDEPAAFYRIYRGLAADLAVGPDTLFKDRVQSLALTVQVDDEQRWFYRVAAVDGAGNEGAPGPAVEARPDATPPGAPTALTAATDETGTTVLSWTAPDGEPIAWYLVRRADRLVGPKVETTRFAERVQGQGTVRYLVSAVDLAGNEGPAASVETAFDTEAPRMLLSLEPSTTVETRQYVTAGTVRLTLALSEPTATEPTLTWRTSAMAEAEAVDLQPVDDRRYQATLTIEQGHDGPLTFIARAVDDAGNRSSDLEPAVERRVDTRPPLPVGRLQSRARPGGMVGLQWAVPDGERPDGATSYRIYAADRPVEDPTKLAMVGSVLRTTAFEVRPKSDGTRHYCVVAVDEAGQVGAPSAWVSATSDGTPPPKPAGVTGTVGPTVRLAWQAEADTSYLVYREDGATNRRTLLATVFGVGGYEDRPEADGEYRYLVVAADEAGNRSEPSSPVRASVVGKVPAAVIECSPPPPLRGATRVNLRTSCPVAEVPTLRFRPASGAEVPVLLARTSPETFEGTLQLDETVQDGPGTFVFMAVTPDGTAGAVVTSGGRAVVDRKAPEATVRLGRSSPLQPGEVPLSVDLNEAAVEVGLFVTLPGERPRAVELSPKAGTSFTGSFVVPPTVKEGRAFFELVAVDGAGNKGGTVANGRFFEVDVTVPKAPTDLVATPAAGGRVDLRWSAPRYGPGDRSDSLVGFRLYRSQDAMTTTTGREPIVRQVTRADTTDTPPTDGAWYYAVTTVDRAGWESAAAVAGPVRSQRTPPPAPVVASATTGVDWVELQLASSRTTETTPTFEIYCRRDGEAGVPAGRVTGTVFRGVPPQGGRYWFTAREIDALGNQSEFSEAVPVVFRKVAPVAALSLEPAGPVGPGGAVVTLRSSRPLDGTPELTFTPPGGGRVAVALEGPAADGPTWRGRLHPPATAPSGVGWFAWRGTVTVDGAAVIGVGIAEGGSAVVDCLAPTFHVDAPSTIRRFDEVPVFPEGTHTIGIRVSEDLAEPPRVTVRLRNDEERTLAVEAAGTRAYRATFIVAGDVGETDGHVLVEGVDRAGNRGTVVERGDSIRVDTTPPSVVQQMRVRLMPEGHVQIEWTPTYRRDGTLDRSADRFEVFRTTRDLKTAEGLVPLRTVDFTLGCRDNPTADGVYRYAVRAIDRAGNGGALSEWASMAVDRAPPEPPRNLAARVTDEGVVELTWEAPEGERPLYYNAYIADDPILTVQGRSPMSSRIPFTRVYGTPNADGVYHFAVTAVDGALNESGPSNCRRLAYQAQVPIARFRIEPDIWLTDGTYTVFLTTTEPLGRAPSVTVATERGERLPLTFSGDGAAWQARMTVDERMPEGTYGFVFRGEDRQGNVGDEIAEGPLFHVDRTAPLPPDSMQARQVNGTTEGAIELTWRTPKRKDQSTEVPYFYHVYRDEEPLVSLTGRRPVGMVKVEYRNVDEYRFVDVPPSDGRWHYAVVSLDLAGNGSEPGPVAPVTARSKAPRATIRLFTAAGGEKPTERVGLGPIRVVLSTSHPLQEPPILEYVLTAGEETTGKGAVALEGSGTSFDGILELTESRDYEQDGSFTFRGRGRDGTEGTFIAQGSTFVVDTVGPVAELLMPDISRYRVDMATNTLTTPPVKRGRHEIVLTSHKPLAFAPKLEYDMDGRTFPVALRGFGTEWRGFVESLETHPEGVATFRWVGVDRAGNEGRRIAPLRKWYRTDENFPTPRVLESFCTVGTTFAVDVFAPDAPTNVRLERRKLGVAVVSWDEPPGRPARYRLYRSLTPIGSVEGMRPVKDDIMARVMVDAPPCDGNWFYAVTAEDMAGNESPPSPSVNMFIDSIKPELKIKPVSEGDGFFIVLEDENVPPELSLTLKFPGKETQRVSLGGTSGELKVIPNYRNTGKPAVFLPQQVEAFNGRVEVIVHSPDPAGNIVDTTTTFEGATVNPATGGTVSSSDESVTLEIPPGLEPVVPAGPGKVKRIGDYENLFFITYANIPTTETPPTTGTVPGRNDLSPLPPGLEVVSKPYTVNINYPPTEPLMLKASATQADLSALKKLTAKLRMRIPTMYSDAVEDPEYLKSRLKVMQWVPATKQKRGRWEPVPDEAIVLDPETRELIVPADAVTTYVIVSEQTPPSIRELQPPDGAAVTDLRPVVSALIVDKGTGVAVGAENRVVLRLDGQPVVLSSDCLSQGDPTEVRVTWQPPEELAAGDHIVTLEAEDVVGNRRVAKWRFTVDNRPPLVEDVHPRDGALVGASGALVVARVLDPGGSLDPRRCFVTVDGTAAPTRLLEDLSLLVARTAPLTDGEHRVTVTVFDRGGKRADRSLTVRSDGTPPALAGARPRADGLVTDLAPLAVAIEDGSGIQLASIRCYMDGVAVPKAGDRGVTAGGWTYDGRAARLLFTPPSLTVGSHRLHATVLDRAGNEGILDLAFRSRSGPVSVTGRPTASDLERGFVVAVVDCPDVVTAVRALQDGRAVPSTYCPETGVLVLATSSVGECHVVLTDRAGDEVTVGLDPQAGRSWLVGVRKPETGTPWEPGERTAWLAWGFSACLLLSLAWWFRWRRRG